MKNKSILNRKTIIIILGLITLSVSLVSSPKLETELHEIIGKSEMGIMKIFVPGIANRFEEIGNAIKYCQSNNNYTNTCITEKMGKKQI